MTYPINETGFCERWLSTFDDPNDDDRELALATVQAINRAYYAGLEAGRDTDLLCIEDSGIKLSETMLKFATEDEMIMLHSICKAIHERSASNDCN